MSLLNHAKPISEVLKDEKLPPRIRELLSQVETIKHFGEKNGLKPTPNYQDYVQLNRPAAVYVVSAAESLHFNAKVWSFPVVGSFPYLGWFDLNDAKAFAESLKREGWDVDVRGARAYSTLGWFRDSVLSSMIPEGAEALGDLANVILHESVHATLYIKGQSYFDESVASFVADKLTPIFLAQKSGDSLTAYLESERKAEQDQQALHSAFVALDELYSSASPTEQKLSRKKQILQELQDHLKWKRQINNATLIQYKTYNTGQADFNSLFESCQADVSRLMKLLSSLKVESFQSPQQEDLAPVFAPLLTRGCG